MLTAERKLVGEESKISLTGVIDESANFQDLIGEPPQGKMAIDLHQVTRINSVGIKIWRDFFQELRSKGKEISFEDIPPALVSAMNYLTDFILKNEVKSVCAPFICSKCKKISLKVVKQEEIAAFASSIPALQCECGGGLEFDEIPEEYFSFFERS